MGDNAFIIFWLLVGSSAFAASFKDLSAEDRFQTVMDKQTFYTILTSIAERLKNLDNIYSIQLSQTLENKLESYHRKIDSLDSKIIRLESLIMMNLDKISENISTKNYKDDVAKTNTFRKLDFLYEGINHRLVYVDRKNDVAHGKMQDKLDLLAMKLDKMEENMAQRGLEIEVELSEVLQFTEDLQTTAINVENLVKMTTQILNATDSHNKISTNSDEINLTSQIKENNNVTKILNTLLEQNEVTMNVTLTTENLLKEMKIKLADDLNSYANKVADMNSYFWKNNEAINRDTESIESTLNSTRVDLKNGIRALMLQIGKKHGKDSIPNEDNIASLKQNMEEILTSQKLFLESCYKVQSDESQIESEISETLDKLIDLFQGQMKSAIDNIRNLDKTLKNHDSRMTRTMYQANTNIISLFDRTVRGDEKVEKYFAELKTGLINVLEIVKQISNNEIVLNKGISDQILNIVTDLNIRSYSWVSKQDLETNQKKLKEELTGQIGEASSQLSNITGIILQNLGRNLTFFQNLVNSSMQDLIIQLKENLISTSLSTSTNASQHATKNETKLEQLKVDLKNASQHKATDGTKRNCTQKYDNLIDIRGDIGLCQEQKTDENTTTENLIETTTKKQQLGKVTQVIAKNCTQNYSDIIDIRGDLCREVQTDDKYTEASTEVPTGIFETTTHVQQTNELNHEANITGTIENGGFQISSDIEQAILDIFGTKPEDTTEFDENYVSKTEEDMLSTTEIGFFKTTVYQEGNNTTTEESVFDIDIRND